MLKFIQYISHHKQFNIYYVFILRKTSKIGIILVAINLLACGHQPDFKDITHLAESGDAGAQAKLGELYVEGQVVPQDYKRPLNGIAKLLIKEMQRHRIIWEQCMLLDKGRAKL